MRIIPFPADEPLPGQDAWSAKLDAALSGEAQDPAAEAWRELRGDVRSLAPAMTPAFEASLARRLERLGALQGDAVRGETQARTADSTDTAPGSSADAAGRAGALARFRRGPRSHSAFAAGATVLVAIVVALLIAGGRGLWATNESPPVERMLAPASGASGHSPALTPKGALQSATSSGAQQVSPLVGEPSAAGAASAHGRVQQLAASVTLGATAASLQSISDQVAQLAVRDGGYVRSSAVQVQQRGASEATLALRLPSARLGAALAAIGRLAPIRAENQSLQDITDAYGAAQRRLSDAEAERRAQLRALTAATTEGQIHALRERLSASRAAVARAHSAVNAVSQRASTAEVEVSILGDARAASEGLTLHRGLHDAGRVLVVALIVLLIAASVLVPLALVLAALVGARSTWRRYSRERVLDGH
jgi:hypothetical protein